MTEQLPKTFFRFLMHFCKGYKWWFISLIAVTILSGGFGTINSYLTKILIDGAVNSNATEKDLLKAILLPAILIVVSFEIQNILWRCMDYIKIKTAPKMHNKILEGIFSFVHHHSFSFFQNNFSGAIANNINKVAENIETIIYQNAMFILRGTAQLIFTLIAMNFLHPVFSISLAIWTIFFLTISLKYSVKLKILSNSYASAKALLSGKIIDSISGVNNVILFTKEIFEVTYLKRYLNFVAEKFQTKEWFLLKLWWLQGSSITILIAVMVFALVKLKTYNLVTVGDFAFILSLVVYVTENVWNLTQQIDKLNDAIGQCNQSLDVIAAPHDIKDMANATSLTITRGEIRFQNVTFQYEQNKNLFQNTSILIPGGQKVGLVGLSGSGKTTFVNLIVRLFELTSGEITVDGQNIATVTQNSLRKNVGFIPQDPVLFHRSIMENIRYGKANATDEEVILSAKKAHAHEFITLTPESYSSLVGDRGVKLSGGQRQRISIARTILKNAPILILDEATSSLDSVTEAYIQESLKILMHTKTVIVIAHRLSTLLNLDRILVFDQGKIIEDGTHHELMRKNGTYALLWNSQIGGFLPEKLNQKHTNTQNPKSVHRSVME